MGKLTATTPNEMIFFNLNSEFYSFLFFSVDGAEKQKRALYCFFFFSFIFIVLSES